LLVSPFGEGELLLVLHTEHSRLAGWLASWWGNAAFPRPEPWLSVILAAQEHDASWATWEMKPYTDADGRPIDFVRGARFLAPQWADLHARAVDHVGERDSYAALLVSLHWESLLRARPELWMPGTEALLEQQRALRGNLIEMLVEDGIYVSDGPDGDLARNQEVLRLVDGLALKLAGASDVDLGPLGLELQADGRAVVQPYPFATDPLVVSVSGRVMPDRAYTAQSDFLAEFYCARRVRLSYTLASGCE
jgi:Protein of unknown function (DUF3891)